MIDETSAFHQLLDRKANRRRNVVRTPVIASSVARAYTFPAMSSAKLHDVIPILDVRNVERAIQFYVERLGFQLDFRYADDPNNYAGVRRDGVFFHMQWQNEEHFRRGTAGRLRLRVLVDDPDRLFEEYRANAVLDEGVRVRDTEWGTREFGFRDLDGNGLVFYRDL